MVVVLNGCPKTEAQKIGENIVKTIQNYDNTPYSRITVSAGVASMPDDAATIEQLVKASDSALMKAKKRGKNQVINN